MNASPHRERTEPAHKVCWDPGPQTIIKYSAAASGLARRKTAQELYLFSGREIKINLKILLNNQYKDLGET